MYRQEALEEISDGRLYGENDMVRADTAGCEGCRQICCHGMENTIVLDPFDVHRLTVRLNMTFEQLMNGFIEMNAVDGIILPNMAMNAVTGSCSFLDENNKCKIHTARPGVCRLFPLGRYWEDETHFKYILQKDQCHKDNLSKIKVKKWINSECGAKYDEFVVKWHAFLVKIKGAVAQIEENLKSAENEFQNGKIAESNVDLDEARKTADTQIRTICMYTLKTFYMTPYGTDEEFFGEIGHRIESALANMGLD
jgi:hypothetical protein